MMKRFQRGGFVIGLIVGVLVGLVAALAVALYVTKVPVPWVNKVPQRTAEQDAAETERNKHWDPNAPLTSRPLPQATAPAVVPPTNPPLSSQSTPAPAIPPAVPAPAVAGRPASGAATTAAARPASGATAARDPAAILAGKPATAPAAPPAVSTATSPDPFTYFVQAGAYGRTEEAEQQRARLAMVGLMAKVTEREQSGRTVYRVRLGPFEKKADADAAKGQLETNGVEAALVRVQR